MTSRLLFTVPVLITFVLIVYHSYKTRGPWRTALFFLWAMIFVMIKESNPPQQNPVGVDGFFPQYSFDGDILGFEIFGRRVVLILVMGWLFAFYVSWHLAARIINNYEKIAGRIFPVLILGTLIMSSISLAMESTASNVGWWHWSELTKEQFYSPLDFPLWIVGAWGFVFFLVMSHYFLIVEAQQGRWWKRILYALGTLFVGNLLFGEIGFWGLGCLALLLVVVYYISRPLELDICLVELFVLFFSQSSRTAKPIVFIIGATILVFLKLPTFRYDHQGHLMVEKGNKIE